FVDDDTLAADDTALDHALASRGFAEATASHRVARLPPEADGTERIAVVFHVDEGDQFLVRNVLLDGGDPALTGDVLAALSSCKAAPGAKGKGGKLAPSDCARGPLRVDELDADADRIKGLYAAKGYPSALISLAESFSDARTPGVVDVDLRVTVQATTAKLDKAVLGEVFLLGNITTNAAVLRRELGVTAENSGQPLDPELIQKGVNRIRRSGLFSRVSLDYVGLDAPNVPVDVLLQVEEKPSLAVDSSIGFSTESLFTLGLEVREKNAFGSMIELGMIIDEGLFIGRQSQLQLPARWPRILGTDLALTVTPFLSYLDESSGVTLSATDPVAGAGQAFLGQTLRRRLAAAGAAASVDYALNFIPGLKPDTLTVGLAYELRSEWTSLHAAPYAPFSADALRTISGLTDALDEDPARVATLTPRIFYSNIDNPFDPLAGASAELLFKASSPLWLSQGTYGVLGASTTGYTTFLDRFTLAGRVSLRWGFSQGALACGECSWALMQSDLLLLGGERSVRGYGENTIGVRSELLTPRLEDESAVGPRPGLFGLEGSVELRMLLWKNLGIGDLKPAVFIDGGVTTDDAAGAFAFADRLHAHELGLSVGAGLRYVMPVGPALFDCAVSPIELTATGTPVAGCSLALGYTF
ncbi:MAG TPA: BamA/TamA family outer membrane protein, partial [Myxococcota bacterium]